MNLQNTGSIKPSKKEEERQFILECIRKYRTLPALWDSKNKDFMCKPVRAEQYKILTQKFRERYPMVSKEEVIKKMHTMKTNYRRELKRIKSGSTTKPPTLWYFKEMSFLPECDKTENKTEAVSQKPSNHDLFKNFENSDSNEDEDLNDELSENEDSLFEYPLKSKFKGIHDDVLEIDKKQNCFKTKNKAREVENIWEKQTFIWASDLSKMKPQQQIFARKAINDIIFEGLMEALDRNSVQINQSKTVGKTNSELIELPAKVKIIKDTT